MWWIISFLHYFAFTCDDYSFVHITFTILFSSWLKAGFVRKLKSRPKYVSPLSVDCRKVKKRLCLDCTVINENLIKENTKLPSLKLSESLVAPNDYAKIMEWTWKTRISMSKSVDMIGINCVLPFLQKMIQISTSFTVLKWWSTGSVQQQQSSTCWQSHWLILH